MQRVLSDIICTDGQTDSVILIKCTAGMGTHLKTLYYIMICDIMH